MVRIALTDGSGSWFDDDKAIEFGEEVTHDGRNYISLSTGSEWEHETLYYTKSGNWVKHWTSQWAGNQDTYEQLSTEDAVAWLVINEYMEHERLNELPAAIREQVNGMFAGKEI
jgi:hypothetical protein